MSLNTFVSCFRHFSSGWPMICFPEQQFCSDGLPWELKELLKKLQRALLLGKRRPMKLCVCVCFLEQNCVFVFVFWNIILCLCLYFGTKFDTSVRPAMSCETLCLCLLFGTNFCVCVCFFEQNFETSARQAMAYIVFLMSEARKVPLTLSQPKS